MQSILAATLIVHVLGLATVTDEVPNDCGVHVIVPRVEYSAGAHAQHGAGRAVEDHTAMLVVHKNHYDDANSTWKMKPLPAYPDYRYLKLDGDQLRVLTNGTNAAPKLANLKLPSLKGCCGGTKKALKSEFQAPYTGAAAVLDVAGGKVTACSAPLEAGEVRYDTEIALNYTNPGVVKISGDTMKQRKEVRLKNLPANTPASVTPPVVYLANLPTCFLNNTCKPKPATAADSAPHHHAYYAMVSGDTSSCQSSLKKCAGTVPGRCKTKMIGSGPQALSFECSNTKWP